MTGEPQVARACDLTRPFREPRCAAREIGELTRERGGRRRFQVRRIAVVPAAVQSPNVAHDEFGLVVDRVEVWALEQLGRSLHCVHYVVEARTVVHEREWLLDE